MASSSDVVYRVREGFTFDHQGRPYTMRRGELVSPGHPAVVPGRMSLLEEVSATAVRADLDRQSIGAVNAVETATAAPGERRAATHVPPRTKTAATTAATTTNG